MQCYAKQMPHPTFFSLHNQDYHSYFDRLNLIPLSNHTSLFPLYPSSMPHQTYVLSAKL